VPCPYFLPKQPLQETGWAIPPRAPLGVLCSGECHATPTPQPADHDRCNFGYARGLCTRFPADAPADAVRFASHADGVLYVLERNHTPVEHGIVRFADGSRLLEAQARVFVTLNLSASTPNREEVA
jgi:hypothetical protein